MELKVWVDGIQRVVCGANLSTTCQDVVVALAHAMGRTGRFTLIEKWRDSERPLTPGECPLQSLHKWGEYAAEVRFYLMQAEPEKPPKKPQKHQSVQPPEMEGGFSHNFTPPPPKPRQTSQASQPVPEAVKRSSTFSGAHSTNYTMPKSSSLHSKLDHLRLPKQQPPASHHQGHPQQPPPHSQQPYHQPFPDQNTGHPSRAPQRTPQQHQNPSTNFPPQNNRNQSSERHQKSLPIPSQQAKSHRMNGNLSAHSSASSNNSSPRDIRTHSRSPGRVHNTSSSPNQDSRLLHPANTPRPSEAYSNYPRDNISPGRRKDSVDGSRYSSDQQHRLKTPDSSPRPVPTPAPRSQHRQLSPSSQPYENLPPRRVNHYADPSSSLAHPSDQWIDPPSSGRSRDPSRERNAKYYNAQSNQFEEQHGMKSDQLYAGRRSNTPHNDDYNSNVFNFNSGFGDDHSPRYHSGVNGIYSDDVDISRSSYPKDIPSSTKSLPFPPQSSQTLPSYSSAYNARTSDGSRAPSKSQTLPSNAGPSERSRRSDGSKVNFVESALLRQQRNSSDSKINRSLEQPIVGHRRGEIDSDRQTGLDHQSGNNTQYAPGMDRTAPISSYSKSPESFIPQSPSGHNKYYLHQPPSTSVPNSGHSSSPDYPQQHPNPHTSAFKVVSPRSSRLTSLSSSLPISSNNNSPIAYNLDNQNFDFSADLDDPSALTEHSSSSDLQPHSRQASLEIVEYDLDQNFPDVFQKEHQSSTLPRASRKSTEGTGKVGHTEYVMDRPKSSSMEPEYMRVLRQVKMQQERLKMVEAQVIEMDAEISSLETDQSNLDLKLDVVSTEIDSLEKTELKNQSELSELDRVEWINVLDGETKCEQDLRTQMSKVTMDLSEMENKLGELKVEEASKTEEIGQEKKHLEDKEKEEEFQAHQKLTETKKELLEVDEMLTKKEKEMKSLEGNITDTDSRIKSQNEEAERLEKLLRSENMKDFQANPVLKESPPSSTTDPEIVTPRPLPVDTLPLPSAGTKKVRPASDSGEAILKILEGRLSPRTPPSPTINDNNSNGKTVPHPYISQTAVKNPNGVWV